jgi:hypothetical protein
MSELTKQGVGTTTKQAEPIGEESENNTVLGGYGNQSLRLASITNSVNY